MNWHLLIYESKVFQLRFVFFFLNFIYLSMATLSLCCCRRAFFSRGEWELLSTCGVWASFAAEPRFWSAGLVTGAPALLS